jgi:hypothetical protein
VILVVCILVVCVFALVALVLGILLRELSIVRLRQGRQDRLHAGHKSHTKDRYCIPKMGFA